MLISSDHLPINSIPKLDINHQLLTIQTAIINQLAQVRRGKLVLDDVLPSLCNQLCDTLQMTGCLIFRADGLELLAASTEQQSAVFWSVCQDFCQYYRSRLAQDKLVLLPINGQPIPPSLQEAAKKGNLSGLLVVPFLDRQSYIGGMALYCEQEREWVPQEISFIKAIADQCATVLAFSLLEERCQQEAKRRQVSETRLKALCNQTCQLMGLLTPEGIVVEANHTALAFIGLRQQDIIGRPFWQMQWWDDPSSIDQQIQEAFVQRLFRGIAAAAKGEFVRYEAQVLGRGDIVVTLDIALTPHHDQTGQVVLLVFEGREITAFKQAQSELQESVARNKALLAAIPDLILRLTRSGIYVDCKTAREDLLVIPVNDCIGKHLHQVLPQQVAGLIWHHIELAFLSDEIQIIEFQLWLNGKSHDFEARIVRSGDDEVVAIVQDVTERVQARTALEQTNQALEVRVEERTAALRESNHILRAEIVDRRKAEVQRRESEERFRQAVVNAPFPIIIYAADGEIVQINQAWTELTGYTHDEIPTIAAWTKKASGKTQKWRRSELNLRKNDLPEFEPTKLSLQSEDSSSIFSCDLNERVDEGEFPLITKNGEHRIWYFRSAPSGCLVDGRSLTISMAIDITESKQTERSQRFLHSVTQAIFESVDFHSALKVALKEVCAATGWDIGEAWVPSADGSVLECSPAWHGNEGLETFHSASVGLTFAPGVGLPGRVWLLKQAQWRRDIASESDESFCRLQLAKQAGLKSGLGIPLFTTTGVLAVLVFYMFESQDEDERLTELISASTDLGLMIQRKQAEGEVHKALMKEKELTELKSRFIAMASHEFRTPLTTIQSSSELLEYYSQKWVHEKKIAHFHRIQTSVKHMTKLLNDVLIIGRAEAGKLTFNPAPVDLESFCHNLVEELQLNDAHQHNITFACVRQLEKSANIDDSLSCPAQTNLLALDETLLRQILENLLSNAIKYSPKGSSIEFRLTYSSTQAVFQIRDQGLGIPPQDQPLLFESFHRATNVGTIAGTGLGLAIVKKCVDIHQGQVAVESEIGVGTTFTVTLPT